MTDTNRRHFLKSIAAGAAVLGTAGSLSAAKSNGAPPNFVIVFCDDLGYGDIGCFGSTKHRTPNIDRMAEEGRRLTSFYVTSGVCTPSRSSLMTSCYPRRVNMHKDARGGWVLFPIAKKGLNPKETTMAEVLKTRGYATACVGKWHLGDQKEFLPTRQGFDSYFGIPYSNDMGGRGGANDKRPPLPLMRDEKVIEAPCDQTTVTKRYAEEAVAFIEKNKDQPFLLYLPQTMPHNPVNSSPAFKGKSANGGYGDSVEEIDWSVGEILKTLKRVGVDDRTMVIFTSDNGAASRWGGTNKPLSGFKGTTMEGGMRVPCVVRWPGRVPAGTACDELACTMDLLPTFAGLAGAKLPKNPIDGLDIKPLLTGVKGAKTPHDVYFYYYTTDLQAVRAGKWKLHLARMTKPRGKAAKTQEPKQIPAKLYDLDADIAESNDLSKERPEIVERLTKLCDAIRDDIGDGKLEGKRQRPAGMVETAVPLIL